MAETLINKNQAGSGIWTQDNLAAGDLIKIVQAPGPVEVTNFSASNYIVLPTLDFSGDDIEFIIHFKTGSSVGAYSPVISRTTSNFPMFYFAFDDPNSSKMTFYFRQSADSFIGLSTPDLSANTEYWTKLQASSTSYKLYQGATSSNMQIVDRNDNPSLAPYGTMDLNIGCYLYWSPKVPWNGSIWISGLKISKYGQSIFDGATDAYTTVGSPTFIVHPAV